MKANGARIIAKMIERQGIVYLPGIPGGANLPLYDALQRLEAEGGSVRHVLARHEQAAGFIAQGMARSTGSVQACLATSGPGATNLITALADAKMDSVPLVAITGQVSLGLLGTDAFQEIDTYGMTQSITKHNMLVRSAGELLEALPAAFRIAASGRPGPVLIDVPKDVQLETVDFDAWPEPGRPDLPVRPDPRAVEDLARMLNASERPILYLGGGAASERASALAGKLAHAAGVPCVTTLMALGCLESGDDLNLGMLGMHGSLGVNRAVEEADLVIAVGARFDDRVTGDPARFARKAAVAHVDADAAEINKIRRVNLSIVSDAAEFFAALLPLAVRPDAREPQGRARLEWARRAIDLRDSQGVRFPSDPGHPLSIMRQTARIAGPEAIVTTDVGQHQMWAAQGYPVNRPRSFLTSGGLGTMGFGLPAAIGAALANPGRKTVCLSGDGSILMNLQELATLAEWGLDLTVVLFDNGHLGLVRQQQDLFYGQRYFGSSFGVRPDFPAIARGFGLSAWGAGPGEDPAAALEAAISHSGPSLVSIAIDPEHRVLPMVPPGKSNLEPVGA